jgi:hypothetical protein
MNLFARARAGLVLSPGERTFLKFVDGAAISAGVAAVTAIVNLLAPGHAVDWRTVAIVGGVAFGTSILAALKKYATAHFDALLAAPITAAADNIQSQLATVRIPFNAPAPTTVTVTPDPVTMSANTAAASGV